MISLKIEEILIVEEEEAVVEISVAEEDLIVAEHLLGIH